MNKILSLALGLALAFGATSGFASDDKKQDKKDHKEHKDEKKKKDH